MPKPDGAMTRSDAMDPANGGSADEPFPRFDEDEAFVELRDRICGARPPLALIGAGASVKSGYPTWPELLRSLRNAMTDEGKAAQWKRNLDDLGDAPWTAEIFCRDIPEGRRGRLLRELFESRGQLADPHLSLARMPFPHYLTTNYDPSIEEALTEAGRDHRFVRWGDTEAVSDFLINMGAADRKPTVLYLHGRYDDPLDEIVLTESSYVSRYVLGEDARRKLMAIFLTHPIVFVGFSMNDPDLANLMREVTARLKVSTPCHFAVMSYKTVADREATRARMEGKFGIRPVFFSRTGGAPVDDYANMVPLLEALARRPLAERRAVATVVRSPDFDPEDPHKGRFGGHPATDGLVLSCERAGGSRKEGSLALGLIVRGTDSRPLTKRDRVDFFYHPTFMPPAETVEPDGGRASTLIESYGAFTVGVEVGTTRLELDLALEAKLPLWFRQR